MIRYLLTFIIFACTTFAGEAQLAAWCRGNHVFDNLEVAFTAGTTGLGVEVATPVTRWTRLRAGWDGMPKFNIPLYFDVTTYSDNQVTSNFDKVQDMMYRLTGDYIDERVKMDAKPNMSNFKLLVDVFPFQNNRHWHFTAGFFVGTSTVGRAISNKQETKSLIAMHLYNRIYNKMEESEGMAPLFGDIYLSHEKYEELMSYGRLGIHIGDYKDGTPYYLLPKPNGSVTAKAVTNAFKPYLGFGYSGACDRAKRLNVGVEAGVLFWGGAPQVILHDGTNMNKDLVNIRGKVGDYMRFIKAFPVYPAVSFKISYTLF